MRRRLPVAKALPLTAALLALAAVPAMAQPPVTTPMPTNGPGEPPVSAPIGPQPLGHAVGDAGTGLGVVRILPNAVPTNTALPGYGEKLPKQSAAELGFGLSSAQANSESLLAQERAIAQASPGGIAVQGQSPQAPGTIAQTALPDNPEPTSFGLNPPSSPLDALIKVSGLNGRVHARWSETLGPCVGTISDASTSVASMSLLNAIPTLPGVPDLTGVFDSPKLDPAADQQIVDGLKKLAGPLSTLGGILSGPGNAQANGNGSLLSLPNTMSTRSAVQLVDMPGTPNKAVRSTSTLQVASIRLLAGTPFELQLNVVSQPTLQVTSTGNAKTSTVNYIAPLIEVKQGGKTLGKLDAANPKMDIPVGVPLPGVPNVPNLPIIGDLLANGQRFMDMASQGLKRLDLGVLRLSVAGLEQKSLQLTEPFKAFNIGATARMLDLQLLPTDALGLPGLPSALAQISLGEQIARAAAPEGGVVCGTVYPPGGEKPPPPQGAPPPPLAYTNAAYQAVPMFWTGSVMLLLGVVLVAALPNRRRQPARIRVGQRPPSPKPRPHAD